VNKSNQFLQIKIFLAQKGFMAILKKLPMASVFLIEPTGVSGKESIHQYSNRNRTGSKQ
jgi:hypothetical protein